MKRYSSYLLSLMFLTSIVGNSLWASASGSEQDTNNSYNTDNLQTQRSGTPVTQVKRIYRNKTHFTLPKLPRIDKEDMGPNDVSNAIQDLDSVGYASHKSLGAAGLISSLVFWYKATQDAQNVPPHEERAKEALQSLKSNPKVLKYFTAQQRTNMAKLLGLLEQKFEDPIFKNYVKDILACFPENQAGQTAAPETDDNSHTIPNHLRSDNSPDPNQEHRKESNCQASNYSIQTQTILSICPLTPIRRIITQETDPTVSIPENGLIHAAEATNVSIMLPITPQTVSPGNTRITTDTGRHETSVDQRTNIPTSPTVLQPAEIPVLPQMYTDPTAPASNNESTSTAVNQIATPTQSAVLPQNVNASGNTLNQELAAKILFPLNIRKPKSRRTFSSQRPELYLLQKFKEIAIKGDMNKNTVEIVHEFLNSVGRVKIQQQNGVQKQEVGWLKAIITWYNRYVASLNIHDNRQLKYTLRLYKERAERSQQSLGPDALNDKTDQGKAAITQYIDLLAKGFKDTPLGEVMENACDRFKGDQAALATVPSILKDAAIESTERGEPSRQESQETVTSATQMTTTPVSSHAVSLVMSPGSNQITHKPNNGTMHATVERGKASMSEPSSPSTSDEGAIGPNVDGIPEAITPSVPEPHGTIDIAPNDLHVGTAAQNSVDREALK